MSFSPSNNDKDLLREISIGNNQAFKELFELYKDRFYATALKMTKSDESAKDIVQDVFMQLWNIRESLGNVDNPSAYLFTILYRKVYMHYRKLALETKHLHKVSLEEESTNTPYEIVITRETKNLLAHIIAKLPQQQKKVFKLIKEEGCSREEAAQKLAISPNTVKNQLASAIKFIRSNFGSLLVFVQLNFSFLKKFF